MNKSLIVLLIFIGCTHLLSAQSLAKGKLFIIGGGSRPDAMVDRIIEEAELQKGGYGIILPMSSSYDSSAYWANEQFIAKGITTIKGLNFIKGESLRALKVDSVRKAKFIYITGGDQNRFMDIVAGTEIEKAILEAYQNGSLIGGTSAGAAVMSKIMITGNELKQPEATLKSIEENNIEIKQGLGLIQNAIIDQHFIKRSRYSRLISIIIEHPDKKGIGIDEATAILVKGNEVEVIGESQVIVIENPRQSKIIKNGKLGTSGLTMTIYLPGDKFKLN
jgi:cyanophycinase